MLDKFFKKKSDNAINQKEPNMGGDRFADMEQDLQENNPERFKEATTRYVSTPVVEETRETVTQATPQKEPRMPVYPSGNKPNVFSSGRNFSKQLGEMNTSEKNKHEQRVQGMPVIPRNQSTEYTRETIREEQVQEVTERLEKETRNHQQKVTMRNDIPESTFPENTQRTANGYLVSVVMNEQQFTEFCKGNKNVLKVFPVLAENPEKAASLMEKKGMIPIEVFDYNFFKFQVERIEQLAAENNILLLRN